MAFPPVVRGHVIMAPVWHAACRGQFGAGSGESGACLRMGGGTSAGINNIIFCNFTECSHADGVYVGCCGEDVCEQMA